MTTPAHPLPDVTAPLTAPFWDATRRGELVAQACPHCSYVRWPPGPICPECQTAGGEWRPIRPSGTLWSFAQYFRAFDPAFADDLPYTVGVIELDDGPRMYGTVLGPVANIAPGNAMRAVFVPVTDEVTLVRWEPIASPPLQPAPRRNE